MRLCFSHYVQAETARSIHLLKNYIANLYYESIHKASLDIPKYVNHMHWPRLTFGYQGRLMNGSHVRESERRSDREKWQFL